VARNIESALNTIATKQVLVLASLLLLPAVFGCQQYGQVSDQSYQYASALLAICNLQNEERLEAVKAKIEDDSELSVDERQWLLQIVANAESGDWEQATNRVRQMMDEQVANAD
jgi:hypothetical protein